MTNSPETAYAGPEPYFFVSYSHQDADLVASEMAWLVPAGFNLWHDDGIHVGSVWRQALADALTGSSGLIFFATQRSTESSNCLKELNFALDEDKPVFVVQLDEHKLPSLLRLSLSDRQALIKGNFEPTRYRSRLIGALSTVVPPAVRLATAEAPKSSTTQQIKTDPPSLAILPLTCLGNDAELSYLAQGIIGDLIVRLSHRVWHVVAGESADIGLEAQEIGQRRNVRYVLDGTVQRGGQRVRLNVRLIRADDGEQIWAQRYERMGEDLLCVQDQLVNSIDLELFDPLMLVEAQRLKDVPLEQLDSWGLCALARVPVVDRASRDRARSMLQMAIERDPDFAYAHGIYAIVLNMLIWGQFTRTPEQDGRLALEQADRALHLAPDSITILSQAATVHRVLGDPDHALHLARRAADIAGAPSDALVGALVKAGQFESALEIAREHPEVIFMGTGALEIACLTLGYLDEALAWARRGTTVRPGGFLCWANLAVVQSAMGNSAQAVASFRRAQAIMPTLTVERFEKGHMISWGSATLIEPLIAPLRALDLN